jgi:predicted amidohydrolase
MKISVIQSQRSRLYSYDPVKPAGVELAVLSAAADADMDHVFGLLGTAVAQGADLIVTTETINQVVNFSDPRYRQVELAERLDGPLMARFCAFARQHRVHVVAGLLTRREESLYNSAVLFDCGGRIAGVFDKVHLPVGEVGVTAGSTYPVFETDFGRIGMLVCWDMQFPEAARALALAGAELIACPTWGWQKLYGCARALENAVTVAAAIGIVPGQPVWADCDPSGVISNEGKVLAEAPAHGTYVVTADVDIHAAPPLPSYYVGHTTMRDMREVRMRQRRPETYGRLTDRVVVSGLLSSELLRWPR